MPGQFNTGRDVSIDFVGPAGPVSFSFVTDFDAKQRTKQLDSDCIDGVSRFEEIPTGWEGNVEIDRANRNMDDLIYQLEQQYYGGQTVTECTITETIREVDLSISQWRYTKVRFKLDSAGSWKKDAKVSMKLGWVASFRQRVQ